MKHKLSIVLILLGLFFLVQILGLMIVFASLPKNTFPLGIQRPELSPETSFIPVFVFLLLGTFIVLLLIRFKLFRFWKVWFLFSIFVALAISFSTVLSDISALLLAGALGLWRVFKPNVYIHNFTELFLYGALAALFVSLFTVLSAFLLLLLISVYDYIAVRKTKHMITLAKSEGKEKVFAGFLIPYKKNVAMLGGGDIGFPLLFASVVMHQHGLTPFFWQTYIIPFTTGLALFILFLFGKRKRFYPAMPYLTLGALSGYGLFLLLV